MKHRFILPFTAILILAAAAGVLIKQTARPAPNHPYFKPGHRLVYSHKGGSGLWPENTRYAFEQCVKMGVDVLEMDVREAKGGELMVIHDETVDRTTNGTGAVKSFTPQQLATLDAGYRWTPDGARSFPYRGKGITIPRLYQILEAFPGSRMNIEIKDQSLTAAITLCELLNALRSDSTVMVASFHDNVLAAFRQKCPTIATAATPGEVRHFFILSTLHLESLYSPSALALQIPETIGRLHLATPRLIRAAHQRNIRVDVWTVNQPDQMRRLLEAGVDGIMTDRPDLLMQLMASLFPTSTILPPYPASK